MTLIFLPRAAAIAAVFLAGACAQTPPPATMSGDGSGDDAVVGSGVTMLTVSGADDEDEESTASIEAAEAKIEVVALPAPSAVPSGRPKPAAGHAPICGALKPGGRATGVVESAGRKFAIECFRASKPGAPAVLLLHGARGLGQNPIYTRLAEALVQRGLNAFVLQYLSAEEPLPQPVKAVAPANQRAGVVKKPAAAAKASAPAARKKRHVDSSAQSKAIGDAITAIQALSYVDHRRIGLFGLSLGAFHALAISSGDERIGAVVDMFGAMPRSVAPNVTRMPPTLVLHGDNDAIVPVRRAHELGKILKSVGAPHEIKIYKGQGHSFRGIADADSIDRSVDFLNKWLRAPAPVATSG